jgi:hypothetical protein
LLSVFFSFYDFIDSKVIQIIQVIFKLNAAGFYLAAAGVASNVWAWFFIQAVRKKISAKVAT